MTDCLGVTDKVSANDALYRGNLVDLIKTLLAQTRVLFSATGTYRGIDPIQSDPEKPVQLVSKSHKSVILVDLVQASFVMSITCRSSQQFWENFAGLGFKEGIEDDANDDNQNKNQEILYQTQTVTSWVLHEFNFLSLALTVIKESHFEPIIKLIITSIQIVSSETAGIAQGWAQFLLLFTRILRIIVGENKNENLVNE